MRTSLVWVAMSLAMVGGFAFGWYEHTRAERLAEAAAQIKPPPAPDCSHAGFASLTRAMSSFVEAKHAGREAPAQTGSNLEDLPADDQSKLFEVGDKLADSSRQDLTELVSRLRLSTAQERQLRDRVATMNQRIGGALDRLIALSSQTDPIRPRAAIDALADGLDAIRQTDDGFRATLDQNQQHALAAEGFDMTSQIDPSILVSRVIAFAVSAKSSDDAVP